jgi:hypothetical protein
MRSPAVTNQELTEQEHRLILDLGAIWSLASGSKESVPKGQYEGSQAIYCLE